MFKTFWLGIGLFLFVCSGVYSGCGACGVKHSHSSNPPVELEESVGRSYTDNVYLVDPFKGVEIDAQFKKKLMEARDRYLDSKQAYLLLLEKVSDTNLVNYLKSNEFGVPATTN